ncbi:hypothetical protein ACIA49_33365 [Kribbella sp. NPDC051587]|uniref:hypothetical protein n=1 Tax=Kribbella sp. NPDC051587 TaxID=3364119 RepID=UPI0037974B55
MRLPGSSNLIEPSDQPIRREGQSGSPNRRIALVAAVQAYVVGAFLTWTAGSDRAARQHVLDMPGMPGMSGHAMPGMPMPDSHERLSPVLRALRDSTLAVPFAIVILFVVTAALRQIVVRVRWPLDGMRVRILFAVGIGISATAFLFSDVVSGLMFSEPLAGVSAGSHFAALAIAGLRYSLAYGLLYVALFGASELSGGRSGPGVPVSFPRPGGDQTGNEL